MNRIRVKAIREIAFTLSIVWVVVCCVGFLQMLFFARVRLPFARGEAKGEGKLLLFLHPIMCSGTALCRG